MLHICLTVGLAVWSPPSALEDYPPDPTREAPYILAEHEWGMEIVVLAQEICHFARDFDYIRGIATTCEPDDLTDIIVEHFDW